MHYVKTGMLWLMGLLYLAAGINHFVHPEFYVKIMPPYLPWHLELVYLSGVAEILLGGLVLIPRTRSLAAWGVIALLIAVFPANLHMVFHSEDFASIPPALLWLRLPLQGVLIAWAYWYTGHRRNQALISR
jgi:uncharacterized membrane protein